MRVLLLSNTVQPLPYENPLCDDYDIEISYGDPPLDAHACVITMRPPVLLACLKK